MKRILALKIFILLVLIITISCQRDKKKEKHQDVYIDSIIQEEEYLEEIEVFFPSPNEVINLITETGIDYYPELVNPINKHESYLGLREKSLGLGVYTSDLAYLVAFEDFSNAVQYLDVVYYMSNDLNISNIMTVEKVERIKENMQIPDSLNAISNELFLDFIELLKYNEREEILSMVMLGSYIEAIYLAAWSIEDFNEQKLSIDIISEQKYAFENCIEFVSKYDSNKDIAKLLDDLEPVKRLFDDIKRVKVDSDLRTESKGKLVFGAGSKLNMTKEQFETLKTEIKRIREQIVSI